MTKKKTPSSAPPKVAQLEIVGSCKRIGNAITTVGLLQARGLTSHVEGGKGQYLVKIVHLYDQEEAGLLLKSLDKAFPTVKWWTKEKEG